MVFRCSAEAESVFLFFVLVLFNLFGRYLEMPVGVGDPLLFTARPETHREDGDTEHFNSEPHGLLIPGHAALGHGRLGADGVELHRHAVQPVFSFAERISLAGAHDHQMHGHHCTDHDEHQRRDEIPLLLVVAPHPRPTDEDAVEQNEDAE